jgi:hypothetical protein
MKGVGTTTYWQMTLIQYINIESLLFIKVWIEFGMAHMN